LIAFYAAALHRERAARADFISDTGIAVWGGKEANDRVRELRKR
jgi:hypothetical protein